MSRQKKAMHQARSREKVMPGVDKACDSHGSLTDYRKFAQKRWIRWQASCSDDVAVA
jgi:hypothetical protein